MLPLTLCVGYMCRRCAHHPPAPWSPRHPRPRQCRILPHAALLALPVQLHTAETCRRFRTAVSSILLGSNGRASHPRVLLSAFNRSVGRCQLPTISCQPRAYTRRAGGCLPATRGDSHASRCITRPQVLRLELLPAGAFEAGRRPGWLCWADTPAWACDTD